MKKCVTLALLSAAVGTATAAEVAARFGRELAAPGIVLRGASASREISFTVPRDPPLRRARVVLHYLHSRAIAARSSLTASVNGVPLSTIPLNDGNADRGLLEAAIPPALLGEYNRLGLAASQHSGAPCEDPFEPSLWTAVLADSEIVFDFGTPLAVPQLKDFPRPLVDVLDYRPARVRFVIPPDAAASAYAAAARAAALIGRHLEFKPAELEVASALDLDRDGSQVAVGVESGPTRLIENPRHKGSYLLMLSGALPDPPDRESSSEDSFLLRDPVTVRGMGAAPIRIPLRIAPDEHFVPYEQKVTLEYSYGSQLDPNRSAMEVSLNSTPLRSVPLARAAGSPSERLELVLPHDRMGLDNTLEVRFHLYPANWNACEKPAVDHLWASLSGNSRFDLPRDRYALLPNLALFRRNGYPFGQERTAWVLPRNPRPAEIRLLLHLAFFLGQTAGRAPQEAYFENELPESVRGSAHLIRVSVGGPVALIDESLSSGNPDRLLLMVSGPWNVRSLASPLAGDLALLHEDGRLETFARAKVRRFGTISWNRRVKYWVMDNVSWMALSSIIALFVTFFFLRFLRRHYFAPPIEAD